MNRLPPLLALGVGNSTVQAALFEGSAPTAVPRPLRRAQWHVREVQERPPAEFVELCASDQQPHCVLASVTTTRRRP